MAKSVLNPFPYVKDHVLLPFASCIEEVDKDIKSKLTDKIIRDIVSLIPDEWLNWEGMEEKPEELREVYYKFLVSRRDNSEVFVKEAENARKVFV